MLAPGRMLIVAMSATLLAQSNARGDLVVESWLLDTGVSSLAGQAFQFSDTVQNPYQETQFAAQVNSYATATFDFGWLGDSAHFDVQTNHYLEQLRGFTVSEGRIHLVPAVDSTISFSGTWNYSWPSVARGQTIVGLDVYDLTADEDVAQVSAIGDNVGLGPPFGTFNLQNSGSLLAGRLYEVYYFAQLRLFDLPPPGTHGEGSGEIHFTLTPVPEPAALALFALSYLILRRRP